LGGYCGGRTPIPNGKAASGFGLLECLEILAVIPDGEGALTTLGVGPQHESFPFFNFCLFPFLVEGQQPARSATAEPGETTFGAPPSHNSQFASGDGGRGKRIAFSHSKECPVLGMAPNCVYSPVDFVSLQSCWTRLNSRGLTTRKANARNCMPSLRTASSGLHPGLHPVDCILGLHPADSILRNASRIASCGLHPGMYFGPQVNSFCGLPV
jgi:hypothetical protein